MNVTEQLPAPMPSAPPPASLVGAAAARAPGGCGELAQGMLGQTYFLVACPVDFFARARVELYRGLPGVRVPPNCAKTAAAVSNTLQYLDSADLGAQVSLGSPIPRSKGLGSSSADLSAAIAATGLALGITLTPRQIGQLALSVEPTDGVMFPGIALFDHRAGALTEELGPPPPVEIVALDFGGPVDTVDFNRVDRTDQWQAIRPETDAALALVREGLTGGDVRLLGRGASRSAQAAQQILFKPRLADVVAFAEAMGAAGVNVAHSGSIIGVLLDARQRRGKSVYRQARQAFPEAETIYHLRLRGGGVQPL